MPLVVRDAPFLLLTPTGRACGPQVEQALRQRAAAHISLFSVLDVLDHGHHPGETLLPEPPFVPKEAAAPMLAEFVDPVARSRQSGALLSIIHREIAAVREELAGSAKPEAPVSESEAQRVFLLMQRLDGAPKQWKASLGAVFRMVVGELWGGERG